MTTLRAMIDVDFNMRKPEVDPLKVQDQVIMKRTNGRGVKATQEVMAGTIVSLSEDKQHATVTIPRAGGKILRTVMPIDQLQPASAIYKRNHMHTNPAFRQIALGRR